MDWLQTASVIIAIVVGVITIIAALKRFIVALSNKYRAPFEELQKQVDALRENRPICEAEFEKASKARKKLRRETKGLASMRKHLANDKETLEAHMRSINSMACSLEDVYEQLAIAIEGIHLVMQHEIKGNHTELLEKWMRESAKKGIEMKEGKDGTQENTH